MKHQKQCFAILRLDSCKVPCDLKDYITVKCIVWSLEEAMAEVKRLNDLNGHLGCSYWHQTTRAKLFE